MMSFKKIIPCVIIKKNMITERNFSMKRILAWAGILIIAAAFLTLIFFTVTGKSPNAIMAVLFCLIILPVLIYGLLMFAKMKKDSRDEDME